MIRQHDSEIQIAWQDISYRASIMFPARWQATRVLLMVRNSGLRLLHSLST